jgi:ADP-ribose pyrophosphatase YjhB (NUDIX family)
MTLVPHTHRVAVNAFVIYNETFLLLKRANEPFIWGPPGGRLHIDEDPICGLQREVKEETGLQIIVFQPITTWFGLFNGVSLLSVDYLCSTNKNIVSLSHEHSDYRWLTIKDLTQHKNIYFSSDLGIKHSAYLLAWQTHLMNRNKNIM